VGPFLNSTVKLPLPDQVIGEKYRLVHRLGQGGMGYVFLAEKLHLGTKVALKFLDPEPGVDPTRLKRFLQEARVSVEVNHPGAAQLLDAGHDEVTGALYLAFEYVDGQDVREVITEEGRLAFDEARDICVQVAEVLAYAHSRGIVHRDVKPENVRMRRDLGGARVKVLDFGIARLVNQGAARLTAEGMLAGTPRYMAPEQIRDLPLDARTDVYALGLLFFEMLTGKPAFDGKNLSQVLLLQMNEPVPALRTIDPQLGHPGVDAFISRACAKAPLERFQNMEEFVGALKGLTVQAWPSPRRKLKPEVSQELPTAPNRPQPQPAGGPASIQQTSPNQQQREATLYVDEESARRRSPENVNAGLVTEPSRPMPNLDLPWDDGPPDPSRLPTSPSRKAAVRNVVGGDTLKEKDGHRPAPESVGEATWRASPDAKPIRWWLWFLLAGLLAAAVALGLAKTRVLGPPPVGSASTSVSGLS
jgi:serine/threonine protein kinase